MICIGRREVVGDEKSFVVHGQTQPTEYVCLCTSKFSSKITDELLDQHC